MGGNKGSSGAAPHTSQYIDEADQLGFQSVLGLLSGQGVSPSPALNSSIVAQQLGGDYDPASGNIVMPDRSVIGFDPNANQFVMRQGETDQWLSAANSSLSDLQGTVYDNPNSPWNMLSGDDQKFYNPRTGRYDSTGAGKSGNAQTGKDYLRNYGGYLDQDYQAQSPYEASSYTAAPEYGQRDYQDYDYTSPTIPGVENISEAARANIYQRGADKIASTFRERAEQTEDFISGQGGSLKGGRAERLRDEQMQDKGRALSELGRDVDTEHEMRVFQDKQRVRDMQAQQDFDTDLRRGEEAKFGQLFGQGERRYGYESGRDEGRYGYEAGRGENRYGYESGRDESRYGYEDEQRRGRERLGIVEGIDTKARDQAYQEFQGTRQQNLQKVSALLDLLRVYGGLEGNAVALKAAEAQSTGSALGGLFGGLGSLGGGLLKAKTGGIL